MWSSLDVENTILKRAFEEKKTGDMSLMKLQKLIYLTYKRYFQTVKAPLFSERFETWKYGPVLGLVHREFKK
jgi:uncharacterized phage-associated protein